MEEKEKIYTEILSDLHIDFNKALEEKDEKKYKKLKLKLKRFMKRQQIQQRKDKER